MGHFAQCPCPVPEEGRWSMKIFKRLFCKHKTRIWEYYPTRVYYNDKPTHGLKIVVCLQCGKVINAIDYAQ